MQRLSPALAQLLGLGTYLAVCIVGGTIGGHFLDKLFDTGRILTLSGLLTGLILAFYGGYRTINDAFSVSRLPGERKKK